MALRDSGGMEDVEAAEVGVDSDESHGRAVIEGHVDDAASVAYDERGDCEGLGGAALSGGPVESEVCAVSADAVGNAALVESGGISASVAIGGLHDFCAPRGS